MIIVEGPDGGGKSTLVKTLSAELGLPVAPRVVGSDTRPLTDLAVWTERNVDQGFQRVIFDRHRLISEPIYSPFKNHEPTSRFMNLNWVADMTWRFYTQCKPIIIYALPPIGEVHRNVQNPDSDNLVVQEWINHIYAGYVARASIDFSRGVGRLYNYKVTRLDDILGWVKLMIEDRESHDSARLPGPRQAPDSATVPGQRRRTPPRTF